MELGIHVFRGALLAIAVAVGCQYAYRYTYLYAYEGPCIADAESDSTVLTVFGTVDPCAAFSETYIEARSRFRQAAAEAGFELFSLEIFENYTTDVAFLTGQSHEDTGMHTCNTTTGSCSQDLVVHTSGVHGIEGYAGSAIQIAFLKNFRASNITGNNNNNNVPSLLLIHAVNPYGMAHYRRVNENNVDLNRNGIHDFSRVINRDPNIAGYDDFDHVFNPVKPFRFGVIAALIQTLLQHRDALSKLKRAMVTGQYHKQNGIFYGGTHLEASNQHIHDFCKHFIAKNGPFRKTTWVDVHTGLGRYGMDTILQPSATATATMRRAVANIFNVSLVPGFTGGDDVHQGYDLMTGGTDDLMRPLFSSPNDWHVMQEFGTHSIITVARALILENMVHNHFRTPSLLIRDAFYPRTPKWRRSILTRGLRVLKQAMER